MVDSDECRICDLPRSEHDYAACRRESIREFWERRGVEVVVQADPLRLTMVVFTKAGAVRFG